MKNRTSFVIAQRISTVMNADLILVLDQGQVVAHGKHNDLLEESEIYADIYILPADERRAGRNPRNHWRRKHGSRFGSC